MSRAVFQPVGQVRLTNVAVVRVTRTGKRFEIACYRNKVVNWRNRVETDLNEVLQITTVFQNVSKGVLANKKDMAKAFGTEDEDEIIRYILDKGEVQVSDKERRAQYESAFRDVATIVSEKCVNPHSNRPYTVSMIENAMRDVHFAVAPNKSAKAQALELIPRLKEVMPIARASMLLRVTAPAALAQSVEASLSALGVTHFEKQTRTEAEHSVDVLVDPGLFRGIEEALRGSGGGAARVEVLQLSVQQEGEADIDLEAARKGVLALQVQQAAAAAHGGGGGNTSDEERVELMPPSGRRGGAAAAAAASDDDGGGAEAGGDRKGAPKKSKKAKRREKEEAAERAARQAEVRQRQEERRSRHPVAAASVGASSSGSGGAHAGGGSKLKCNTCAAAFADTTAYRDHFKSDWHRYNLKLKMKGVSVVSEDEFRSVDAEGFFFEEKM
ncbi:SBDS protein C-terminal domain-containing protein [Tribonema minus]|uniref:SBDS protein C-terminal domain-containing protein n=1 Tax=Tribonema minus TaxID=303371 RepID=A0A835Z759_9STRA|nr:SBDS protein C-terminal domain-containing protein [Tribonema minus]